MTWMMTWAVMTFSGPAMSPAPSLPCVDSLVAADGCAAECAETSKSCTSECRSLKGEVQRDCVSFCKRTKAQCVASCDGLK